MFTFTQSLIKLNFIYIILDLKILSTEIITSEWHDSLAKIERTEMWKTDVTLCLRCAFIPLTFSGCQMG